MVEIFAIKLVSDDEFLAVSERLLRMLPEESRASVKRFRMARDFQRSLLGEALTRHRLSVITGTTWKDLSIRRLEKGKPRMDSGPEVHFNISHSGDWVVVATSEREVGIDVELIRPPQYRIAERFFSGHERKALNSLEGEDKMNYFFDLWTLKESYLKLLGRGLTQSLGSFTLHKGDQGFKLLIRDQEVTDIHFRQYPIEAGYKLSVCSRDPEFCGQLVRYALHEFINEINNGPN